MSHAEALLEILAKHEIKEARRRSRYKKERETLKRSAALMEELLITLALAEEAVNNAKHRNSS